MWGKIIAVCLAISVFIAVADKRGVFGHHEERLADFLHLVFEFVDAESRAPISDVHVACTRPMVRSACSEKRGPKIGQTTITLAVYRRVKRTLFFSEELGYALGSGGIMDLTFIAANHQRASLVIGDDDPILAVEGPNRIELTKNIE